MLICNVKLDHKCIVKFGFIVLCLIVLGLTILGIYRIFGTQRISDSLPVPNVAHISSENYTNILKAVHDHLADYLGQTIQLKGYVYRVYDFDQTQFVLARNMVVTSDQQTLVVGFLSHFENAAQFTDGTWVEVTGTITKGDYHGEIPVLEVQKITACEKPQDDLVSPPDDTYIPTSALF